MRQSKKARYQLSKIFLILFGITILASIFPVNYLFTHTGYKNHTLEIVESWPSNSREVSGLTHWKENNTTHLAWVGDHDAIIHSATLDQSGIQNQKEIHFGNAILEKFSPCGTSIQSGCYEFFKILTRQWEAIAYNNQNGLFYVLHEPTSSIYILDPRHKSNQILSGILHLSTQNFPQFSANSNHYAEGLAFDIDSQNIWISSEFPPKILKFHRSNQPSKSSHWGNQQKSNAKGLPTYGDWTYTLEKIYDLPAPYHTCDISEMSIDSQGKKYLLSQKCNWIGQLKTIAPEKRSSIEFEKLWYLPAQIKNAEGLTVLNEGVFALGLDLKKSNKKSLVLVKEPHQQVHLTPPSPKKIT